MPSKGKLKKERNRYKPRLLSIQGRGEEKWKEKTPRITEAQREQAAQIAGQVHSRYEGQITRRTFATIHERIEEEVADRVKSEMGMWAGIEWRGIFSKQNYEAHKELDPVGTNPCVDDLLPTEAFLSSDTFDHIEIFQPRVVLFSFDDYTSHIDSAEQAVREAERRRGQGDSYFDDRDQAVRFAPRSHVPEDGDV